MVDPDFINAVRASSQRLGINPSDLLTAIGYETGGKYSPSLWGGRNNNYLGLIQFGEPERAKYGVTENQSATDQMGAVENYLRDRGVKAGMGLLDIYSTINAGSPGHYNASDANNGGAPGTVADKVATQMVGHRARANALLAANPEPPRPPADIPNVPAPPQQPDTDLTTNLQPLPNYGQGIPQTVQPQPMQTAQQPGPGLDEIRQQSEAAMGMANQPQQGYAPQPGFDLARALMQAMQARQIG